MADGSLIDQEELRVGCVGAVLTFPQFRREGHASKLMRRAAQHIRQTADVGMLFCDAVDAPFYERLDWSALPADALSSKARSPIWSS